MTKARDLADFVSAGNPLADGTIDVADINGITATTAELNYTDGVTSNIQTQLDAKLPLSGGTMTGDVTFSGTQLFDGRDVSADGTKLDGIETGATADQTKADIDALGINAATLGGNASAYFTGYTDTAIANLVASAPATLDTLNELAAALGDDASFSTTVTNSIATKVAKAGDTMTGDLTFTDNNKARFGNGFDLQIYHNGTESIIHDFGTGNLRILADDLKIENAQATATLIYADAPSGAVSLYNSNAVKLATTSTGIAVTGDATFADNGKAIFGAGSDLQIYHDGSASFIQDVGTGSLKIAGQNVTILNAAGTETMAVFTPDAGVSLKYDNATKFDTTSTGIDVTGTITADGLDMEDNHQIKLGTSDDLLIYHDGTNSYVQDNGSGSLLLKGTNLSLQANNGENFINCIENAQVALRYNNSTKFETQDYGAIIYGSAVASTITASISGSTDLDFNANQNFVLTVTANATLNNPTTEKVGQSGFIVFIHSGAGRTISLGSDFETAGGAGLTLSATAGATDVVPYIVAASGRILLGTPQLAFS